jgi:hypothetical protein
MSGGGCSAQDSMDGLQAADVTCGAKARASMLPAATLRLRIVVQLPGDMQFAYRAEASPLFCRRRLDRPQSPAVAE